MSGSGSSGAPSVPPAGEPRASLIASKPKPPVPPTVLNNSLFKKVPVAGGGTNAGTTSTTTSTSTGTGASNTPATAATAAATTTSAVPASPTNASSTTAAGSTSTPPATAPVAPVEPKKPNVTIKSAVIVTPTTPKNGDAVTVIATTVPAPAPQPPTLPVAPTLKAAASADRAPAGTATATTPRTASASVSVAPAASAATRTAAQSVSVTASSANSASAARSPAASVSVAKAAPAATATNTSARSSPTTTRSAAASVASPSPAPVPAVVVPSLTADELATLQRLYALYASGGAGALTAAQLTRLKTLYHAYSTALAAQQAAAHAQFMAQFGGAPTAASTAVEAKRDRSVTAQPPTPTAASGAAAIAHLEQLTSDSLTIQRAILEQSHTLTQQVLMQQQVMNTMFMTLQRSLSLNQAVTLARAERAKTRLARREWKKELAMQAPYQKPFRDGFGVWVLPMPPLAGTRTKRNARRAITAGDDDDDMPPPPGDAPPPNANDESDDDDDEDGPAPPPPAPADGDDDDETPAPPPPPGAGEDDDDDEEAPAAPTRASPALDKKTNTASPAADSKSAPLSAKTATTAALPDLDTSSITTGGSAWFDDGDASSSTSDSSGEDVPEEELLSQHDRDELGDALGMPSASAAAAAADEARGMSALGVGLGPRPSSGAVGPSAKKALPAAPASKSNGATSGGMASPRGEAMAAKPNATPNSIAAAAMMGGSTSTIGGGAYKPAPGSLIKKELVVAVQKRENRVSMDLDASSVAKISKDASSGNLMAASTSNRAAAVVASANAVLNKKQADVLLSQTYDLLFPRFDGGLVNASAAIATAAAANAKNPAASTSATGKFDKSGKPLAPSTPTAAGSGATAGAAGATGAVSSKEYTRSDRMTLEEVLTTPQYAAIFRANLKKNLCSESMNFLEAVIAYETIEQRGLKKMVYAARAIEDQFINESAPELVNLDYKTRGAISHALKSRMKALEKYEHSVGDSEKDPIAAAENKKKLKRLFRPAFHAIAALLDADAYERFFSGPDFKEMLKVPLTPPMDPTKLQETLCSMSTLLPTFALVARTEDVDDLEQIAQAMAAAPEPSTNPNQAPAANASRLIKTRRYHLKLYEDSFPGSMAVTYFLRTGLVRNRHQAVALGQRMLDSCVLRHVTDEHDFTDSDLLYTLKFNPVTDDPALIDTRTIQSGYLLFKGLNYVRMFARIAKSEKEKKYGPTNYKRFKLYLYRDKKATTPHSAYKLRGAKCSLSELQALNDDDAGGIFHKPGDEDDSDSDSDVEEKIKLAASKTKAANAKAAAAAGANGAGAAADDDSSAAASDEKKGAAAGGNASGGATTGSQITGDRKADNLWGAPPEHSRQVSTASLPGSLTGANTSGRKKPSLYTTYGSRALICYLHLKVRIPKKRQLTFRIESDKLRNAWIRGLLASGVTLSQWDSEENEKPTAPESGGMFG